MEEANQVRFSVVAHSVAAILMGWLSVVIDSASRALFAGIAGIVVLFAAGFLVQAVVGRKGRKWLVSNGAPFFLLVWAVSWIFFHNIGAFGA